MIKRYFKFLLFFLIISVGWAVLGHLKIIPLGGRSSGRHFYRFNSLTDFFSYVSILMILLSIIFIAIDSISRRKIVFICPSCEHTEEFNKNDTDDKVCSKCSAEMAPLKGYYEN